MREKALMLLKKALNNPQAEFRDGQWQSIEQLLDRKRMLVVQRTGWGKSMVYFLASKLMRGQGSGPTLLISPLLSLMRNQLRESLKLQNINMPSPAARMAWLAETLPNLSGSGIIYTLTQRDAERLTEWLQVNNINAKAYHAFAFQTMGMVLQLKRNWNNSF